MDNVKFIENIFLNTGSIEAYLIYKEQKCSNAERDNNEFKC